MGTDRQAACRKDGAHKRASRKGISAGFGGNTLSPVHERATRFLPKNTSISSTPAASCFFAHSRCIGIVLLICAGSALDLNLLSDMKYMLAILAVYACESMNVLSKMIMVQLLYNLSLGKRDRYT